jgi:hypothetical protein
MNEILAMLFPLTVVVAVGLTALWVAKPWRKRSKLPLAGAEVVIGQDRVLSPQATKTILSALDVGGPAQARMDPAMFEVADRLMKFAMQLKEQATAPQPKRDLNPTER